MFFQTLFEQITYACMSLSFTCGKARFWLAAGIELKAQKQLHLALHRQGSPLAPRARGT
jgi:hypothetical protein